jgi:serine/threonine-protein kinase RsbW
VAPAGKGESLARCARLSQAQGQETAMSEHLRTRAARPVQDQEEVGSRTFAGKPHEVSQARAFAAEILGGCPVSADVILCVSEFSANAVLHSRSGDPGGRFTVQVEMIPGDYVWVEVEDGGGPWGGRADDDLPGHGLDIVGKIASEWGVDGYDSGWVVWARFDWPTG